MQARCRTASFCEHGCHSDCAKVVAAADEFKNFGHIGFQRGNPVAELLRHWTYDGATVVPAADLEQGDILRPTPALRTVFAEVHPHFVDQKY